MTYSKRLRRIAVTVTFTVVLDQLSKYLAIILLDGRGIISLLGDCLRFVLAHNKGGFLSLGAALPDDVRTVIFLGATSFFLLGFFFYTLFDASLSLLSLTASAMIIGGGIGNLIDRGFRDGVVIDFVNIGLGRLRTGIFNIADMAVLFGCILLVYSLKKRQGPEEAA